jgi:hypothetical protein
LENAQEFANTLRQTLEMALRDDKREELEHICLSLRRAMMQLKFGNSRRMGPVHERFEVLRDAISPRIAAEVAMQNAQAARVLWQTAKELPDSEWMYRLSRAFNEVAFHRRHPMAIMERDPDAWIAWLQLMQATGGWRILERHRPGIIRYEFFDRAFDPRHLLELSKRNPEAALAWVQLAREVGGEGFLRRLEPEFFERAFNPRYLLELSERNPEAALAWVQLAREVGGKDFLRRLEPEFFERLFSHSYFTRLLRRKPVAFATMLRLVRSTEDARGVDAILAWLSSALGRLRGAGSILNSLPLSTLPDIQWLCNRAADSQVGGLLRDWLRENGLDRHA